MSNWTDGNDVKLLINGEDFFPAVFEAIKAARHEVLLETFIIAEDKVGIELQQALIAAAKRGARVHVMTDDYGTVDITAKFVSDMIDAGINIQVFDPAPRAMGMRTNIFRRLHRKIVVVDGEIAFVGGINYSAEHLSDFGAMAKQDYAVQVRGPIVNEIHKASQDLLLGATKKHHELPQPLTLLTPKNGKAGDVKMKMVVRDNNKHTSDIEKEYLRMIKRARKRVVIANAYFFPGYRLLRAIRNASRRGLEVILILQGQPDMPWVSACSRLLYNYLIKEGVTIYEYCQRPLHGKVALVDDEWVTIGSSNLDPLSLAMNLEANLIIEDRHFNQYLYEHLTELSSAHCKPISLEIAQRGYWWRLPVIFVSFHFLRYFPAIAGWFPAHKPELKPMRPEDLEESLMAKNQCEQEKVV